MEVKQCEMCKDEEAATLCFDCHSYFCEACFKYIHDRKKKKSHKKEKIDLFIPIDTKCPEHEGNPMNLFCIEEKELCCGYCIYLNLHKGHKVIPITDEETIKKENININKEFKENYQKVTNLKDKIENEIIEIDKLYEKVNKEVIEYFKRKHEELIKKEKEIEDNLRIEVTKTKEELEEYLSFLNKIIKNIERINKGIKALEKEEKNMIKILTYISKINKNDKEIKN